MFEIGSGATLTLWSDSHAYTVLKRTAKSVTLQRDKATLLNGANSGAEDALQFSAGGFVGHTSGQQRWAYEADPKGEVIVARLTKMGWKYRGMRVSEGRHEHYDFNF